MKFGLDFHRIYCYNLLRMAAWIYEVADTLGEVVPNASGIREFVWSESILDIDERRICMANTKVRINLKAYDHRLLDNAAVKIVETVKRTGGEISGPVPLPTEIQKYTVLRAVHKYKDSREQFEMRTHKRLLDIKNPSKETIDALTHLDLPSGVDIDIKL